MNEASKTKALWTEREWSILRGEGIDIGCGPDPVLPNVARFDVEQGDANVISQYVNREFDFVFSSHCLEHMVDPAKAIREWWKLVRKNGHLFLIVPDEDLYEQGVFPPRFNRDHKATFTISKRESWSPVSVNLLDLVRTLPHSEVVSIQLQDHNYDRALLHHGRRQEPRVIKLLKTLYFGQRTRTGITWPALDRFIAAFCVFDQTLKPDTLAQIQCIVKKLE